MLIKWINCIVKPGQRDRFSLAQQKWSKLKDIDGFIAQTGGWNEKDPLNACIMGMWRDLDSYQTFMNEYHDEIFQKNGQVNTYDQIEVRLFHSLMDIPGEFSNLHQALKSAAVIRVSVNHVYEDRKNHFAEVQEKIWNPGMGEAEGMLYGLVGHSQQSHQSQESLYLITSFWRDQASHQRYKTEVFPIQFISGKIVLLEESWLLF